MIPKVMHKVNILLMLIDVYVSFIFLPEYNHVLNKLSVNAGLAFKFKAYRRCFLWISTPQDMWSLLVN